MPRTITHTEELSVLSFENRSDADKENSLMRVAGGNSALKASPSNELRRDVSLITDSTIYRTLPRKTMLAPSISHIFHDRGSHSIMVSEIGKEIAERLHLGRASEELVSAISHAHDMSHLPFSHEGEDAVNETFEPLGIPKFDHDKFLLAVLLKHASHGISYDGLPLTTATIEGVAKRHELVKNTEGFPREFIELSKKYDFHLGKFNHIEGQISATSDWIAGTVSDIQDMIKFYLASDDPEKKTKQFFDELCKNFPPAKKIYEELLIESKEEKSWNVRKTWKTTKEQRIPALTKQFCTRLKEHLINNVVDNANGLLEKHETKIVHAEDVRNLPELIATPSPELKAQLNNLKEFYHEKIYPEIFANHCDGKDLVKIVFNDYFTGKVKMTDGWNDEFEKIENSSAKSEQKQKLTANLIVSYLISNITDVDILRHIHEHHPEKAKEISDIRLPTCHMYEPFNSGGAKGGMNI